MNKHFLYNVYVWSNACSNFWFLFLRNLNLWCWRNRNLSQVKCCGFSRLKNKRGKPNEEIQKKKKKKTNINNKIILLKIKISFNK